MARDFDLTKQLKAAEQLRGTREKARAGSRRQQLHKNNPLRERQRAAVSIGKDRVGGAYTNRQARAAGKGQVLEEADRRGKLNRLELQAALAQKRRAERMKQAYLAATIGGEDASRKKEGKDDDDYPNPIGTLSFFAFGLVAAIQDLLPLVFDLLAIGWIVAYILLPFTWFCYWYIIVRRAPKSLQRKFIMRTALVTAAGLIPYLGELLPEWIATAIGAWIYIRRYESGAVGLEEISSTTKNLVQGKSA